MRISESFSVEGPATTSARKEGGQIFWLNASRFICQVYKLWTMLVNQNNLIKLWYFPILPSLRFKNTEKPHQDKGHRGVSTHSGSVGRILEDVCRRSLYTLYICLAAYRSSGQVESYNLQPLMQKETTWEKKQKTCKKLNCVGRKSNIKKYMLHLYVFKFMCNSSWILSCNLGKVAVKKMPLHVSVNACVCSHHRNFCICWLQVISDMSPDSPYTPPKHPDTDLQHSLHPSAW